VSPITRAQIAVIKVAVGQIGLEDQDYRALLNRVAGVASSRDLDQRGFSAVMDELARLGFRSTSQRKPFASRSRPGFATNAQVATIRKLWLEWAGAGAGFSGLETWIERTFGVSSLRFLTLDAAPGAIAALRSMVARRGERQAAQAAGGRS
jgi:hypothetical protein